MSHVKRVLPFALILLIPVGGCGLFVPEKDFLRPDSIDPGQIYSTRGDLEDALVRHIKCGIEKGLWRVEQAKIPNVEWLYKDNKWGTAVNLTIQVDELRVRLESL